MRNRRSFLKNISLLGMGATVAGPLSTYASPFARIDESSKTQPDAGGAKRTVISILQTTDVHCQVHPHDELFWENGQMAFRKTGGYAYVSALLNKIRRENPNTFTLDTGDMFQGSELSVETTGQAFVPVLNAMKYDLYLPGNWEVVYGKRTMQDLLGSLHGPKVCANMYHDLGGGKKGELIFRPYHIWNVAGVKIGFLGYTDHMVPQRQSPLYSEGILYTAPEENLAHYVDVLRNQEKCAFVAIIAHLGLSQQIALADNPDCEGVDYILGGDTHERVRKPIQCKYSKVVEPGAFGSFVGKLDLIVEGGKVIGDRYELLEVSPHSLKPDETVAGIIRTSEAPHLESIEQVIGYSTVPLYRYFVVENTIDTLILDALKWNFPEIDIALSNGFRFCPPRVTRDKTGNIPITNGYLFDMLPVDSTIRTGKVTGAQISKWLEKELNNVFADDASRRFGGWVVKFKGMEVEFNAFGAEGKRVQNISIGGLPMDPEKTYSLLACEREGDPDDMLCRMKNVKETQNTSITLHGTLKNYLAANSPVTPVPRGNAMILDGPATLLTQVSGVDYQFV